MGNNISANSLFHFTGNFEYLQSILNQGFQVRYSRESFESLLEPIEDEKQEVLLPMVCFCDIPLSNITEHTAKYGNFGIGLTKEWGEKHGLSPVIYSHPNAATAKIISKIRNDLTSFFDIEENEYNKLLQPVSKELTKKQEQILKQNDLSFLVDQLDGNIKLFDQIGDFIKYIKPYSGIGYSNGKEIEEIIFYNEKEWRYVPTRKDLLLRGYKDSYSVEIDRFEATRRAVNIKIGKTFKLTFEPNDIKYLIVNSESEIPTLIEFIHNKFKKTTPHDDMVMLYSKIISVEQIKSDF